MGLGLSAVSRAVCSIAITPFDSKGALIAFDFLDYRDGALLKILTEDRPISIKLVGDIIGMPQGIRTTESLTKSPFLNWCAGVLIALLFSASFAGAAVIFHSVVGSWKHIWVLLLPFGALFIPAIVIALVAAIWPDKSSSFADTLRAPAWYRKATHLRFAEGLQHADSLTQLQIEDLENETKEGS